MGCLHLGNIDAEEVASPLCATSRLLSDYTQSGKVPKERYQWRSWVKHDSPEMCQAWGVPMHCMGKSTLLNALKGTNGRDKYDAQPDAPAVTKNDQVMQGVRDDVLCWWKCLHQA